MHKKEIRVEIPEGWEETNVGTTPCLQRKISFSSYMESIAFVTRLAEISEANGHHPKIIISYGSIEVVWWTHTEQKITVLDLQMAKLTNDLLSPFHP